MDSKFNRKKISYRRGYPIIYDPKHHKASKNGMVEVHYIIAEQNLGRPLKEEEVVHHRDENRLNYDPKNLMVFDSTSSHTSYHNCMKNNTDMILIKNNGVWHCEATNGSTKINGKWICPVCGGTKKTRKSIMCEKCSRAKRAERIPKKEVLIEDKENLHSFCAIGRKYNVSDNTIRKWFRKYNLPL